MCCDKYTINHADKVGNCGVPKGLITESTVSGAATEYGV